MNQSNTPESPNTPTQVTLAKAPTPWLQNKNKPQEELPEWVKRSSVNKATSPSSEGAAFPTTVYVQVQQSPSQHSQTKQKHEQDQYLISQRPPQQLKPQQTNPIAQSHQHEHVIPIRVS